MLKNDLKSKYHVLWLPSFGFRPIYAFPIVGSKIKVVESIWCDLSKLLRFMKCYVFVQFLELCIFLLDISLLGIFVVDHFCTCLILWVHNNLFANLKLLFWTIFCKLLFPTTFLKSSHWIIYSNENFANVVLNNMFCK